ncbi:MAG: Hsp20 family protein [Alphaproteobacteria bacterium]|jgi:HSP20 family molecular chaperone IbpA|nr:Hsp20 family protein [Alphaproteobacteria bacterium]
MTRVSLFSSPFFLGFEQFERTLDRVSKTSNEGYPPYNIERLGEDRLRITLAVAGFGLDDLCVQIADNELTVRGRSQDDKDRDYLYRGIATRQFQRTFVLADGIEVSGAWLDNGLLSIDLDRPVPESRVRTIAIERPEKTQPGALTVDAGRSAEAPVATARTTDRFSKEST